MRNMVRLIYHRLARIEADFNHGHYDSCLIEESIESLKDLVNTLETTYRS